MRLRSKLLPALLLAGTAAQADPLPVHTPALPETRRPVRGAEEARLQVANAVADTLRATLPEVLSGDETRERITTLTPPATSRCASAACAGDIMRPLHARGLVLVTQSRDRDSVFHLRIEMINLRGEVTSQVALNETIGDWNDATALAREAARRLATPAPEPGPAPALPAGPPPPVTPRGPDVVLAPQVPTAPPTGPVLYRTRPVEALLGAALLAAGVAGATAAVVSLARDGTLAAPESQDPSDPILRHRAQDTALVVGGLGALALGVGTWFVFSGLRARAVERPAAPRVGATVLAGGGLVSVSSAF